VLHKQLIGCGNYGDDSVT